jgi:hypothetical protein
MGTDNRPLNSIQNQNQNQNQFYFRVDVKTLKQLWATIQFNSIQFNSAQIGDSNVNGNRFRPKQQSACPQAKPEKETPQRNSGPLR